MAIKLVSREYCECVDDYKKQYIADTDSDLSKLPTGSCVGSTAVSIASGKVMVVNTSGKWVTFGG